MLIFYSTILLYFKVLYLEIQSEVHPKFYFGENVLIGISLCCVWKKSGVKKILDVVKDGCKLRTSCF